MANAKLHVTGMHCGNCQSKVEKALTSVAGVYTAIVDWQGGEAEIDFNDDAVTAEQLVNAIQKVGYGAKLAG